MADVTEKTEGVGTEYVNPLITIDGAQGGESGLDFDTPNEESFGQIFGDNPPEGETVSQDTEEYINPSEVYDRESQRKFVRSLTPEYKAESVYEAWCRESGRQLYGHEKKMAMRKLVRDARKGRLDRYFFIRREADK